MWYRFIALVCQTGALQCITTTLDRPMAPGNGEPPTPYLRGLEPPEPTAVVLQAIESGEVDTALVGHFDQEPIFLYPELEEHRWSHETIESHCGDCEGGFMLRMVRWGK